jgi:ATP phosphoribosyltransferase
MLNIALPKGRLGDKVYSLFAGIGYECALYAEQRRKLVLTNEDAGVSYFLVKPADVAIYVERGVADIGVVGRDTLLESGADVYELLDLRLGKCRMAVAGPADFRDDPGATLRVATKYPNIAKGYYAAKNRDIEIIALSGSIELAPILGLSDVIVDIVETGTTLKENNLAVLEEILPVSARLIANKSGYKFKSAEIDGLVSRLRDVL